MERRFLSESGGDTSPEYGGLIPGQVSCGSSTSLPDMAPSSGKGGSKICGVCGDLAKSYHFGGLSCDSCKAFFRRSVQNDNYLNFQCCHSGNCQITLSTRKSCQYCRMKRCFSIGMEKSWVMTEEERINLMKARAEKKLQKQTEVQRQPEKASTSSASSSPPNEPTEPEYQPRIDQMTEYLSPAEIKEIEDIVTKYLHSYQHVPYRTELKHYDEDRPGVQVMEMFGTLIRRFAFYSRLIPSFAGLTFQDQSTLLKGGVLEMCLLRGALVFDAANNCWPNINVQMYKDAPRLKLENIYHITSSRLFQMHMEFIACIQQMNVDEPTVMLVILLVLFTPERMGLTRMDLVGQSQEHYTSLLQRYMNWRYGSKKARQLFSRMLTKLSDLRELSDTHNHHNLRLCNEEVSSIQSQLSNLKLNPYPEFKVVGDANTSMTVRLPPAAPAAAPAVPVAHAVPAAPVAPRVAAPATRTVVNAVNPNNYSAIHQPAYPTVNIKVEAEDNYSEYPQANPYNQHHFRHPQNGHSSHQYQQYQQPHQTPLYSAVQQQSSMYPPLSVSRDSTYSDSASSGGSSTPSAAADYYQSYRDMGENMGAQFMKVMQQSISQVLNVPHFGYEWVTPDYVFNSEANGHPPVLQEQPIQQNHQPIQHHPTPLVQSPPTTNAAPVDLAYRKSMGCVNGTTNVNGSDAAGSTSLTPEVMEELYEALEEFVTDHQNVGQICGNYSEFHHQP